LVTIKIIKIIIIIITIGDWGLGIGDCPIPNPQSPIPNINKLYLIYNKNKGHLKNKYNKITN